MKKPDIEKKTLNLLKKHKVKGKWSVCFKKLITNHGSCDEANKLITYDQRYIPNRIMQNIIIHEVAHAIVGNKENHNAKWKAKCIELGGTGKLYEFDSKTYKKVEWKIREKTGKYKTHCKKCKSVKIWYRGGIHKCCGEILENKRIN
jgi:hypothetical protein